MAIKVLYRGTKPSEVIMEGTCISCKTKIECLQGDLTQPRSNLPSESGPGYVVCPTCGSPIYPKQAYRDLTERDYCFEEGNRG